MSDLIQTPHTSCYTAPLAEALPAESDQREHIRAKDFANGVRIQLTNWSLLPFVKDGEMAAFRNGAHCASLSEMVQFCLETTMNSY